MNNDKFKAICQVIMPTIAALGFLAGLVTVVGTLTFDALPVALKVRTEKAFPTCPWLLGPGLLTVALVAGIWTLVILEPITSSDDAWVASDARFTRYLIGIGYFLFVDAIVNMVAFAGFAYSGKLKHIFPVGDGGLKSEMESHGAMLWLERIICFFTENHSDNRVVLTVLLMLSLAMALLGALFFFANALWDKFKEKKVFFNRNVFWGGLWFRLAEAIVFTIAVFLFLQFQGYHKAINYLPMIGLFIGITVKSSETLVFGLADRLLASITSLVQAPKVPPPTPPPTPPPK